MIPTITEVIQVSFQVVQVTLRPSARTSAANLGRLAGNPMGSTQVEPLGGRFALAGAHRRAQPRRLLGKAP